MNKYTFNTYGALARPPMFFGIPIHVLVSVLLFFIVAALLGVNLIGGKGLLILFIAIPILLVARTLCQNDDQALSIIGFELMCFFMRKNTRFFKNTFTVVPDRQERVKDIQSFFRPIK